MASRRELTATAIRIRSWSRPNFLVGPSPMMKDVKKKTLIHKNL
jgi:hypothetical protein